MNSIWVQPSESTTFIPVTETSSKHAKEMENRSGSGYLFCDRLLLDHRINSNWATFFFRWKSRRTKRIVLVWKTWRREVYDFPPSCFCFRSLLWKGSKMGSFVLGTNMITLRQKKQMWWEPFRGQMLNRWHYSRVIYIPSCCYLRSLHCGQIKNSLHLSKPHHLGCWYG